MQADSMGDLCRANDENQTHIQIRTLFSTLPLHVPTSTQSFSHAPNAQTEHAQQGRRAYVYTPFPLRA